MSSIANNYFKRLKIGTETGGRYSWTITNINQVPNLKTWRQQVINSMTEAGFTMNEDGTFSPTTE